MSRQRIRRAVVDQLDAGPAPADAHARAPRRSGRRLAVTAAALAAACLVIGAGLTQLWRGPSPAKPRISRVVTEASPSHLVVTGAELTVAARSTLTVSEDGEGGVHLALEAGRVDCSVVPRAGRPPFVVWAGDVQVEVRGTRFAVTRAGADVEVSVDKGTVRVVRAGEATLVGAGGRWTSASAPPEKPAAAEEAPAPAEAPPLASPPPPPREHRSRKPAAEKRSSPGSTRPPSTPTGPTDRERFEAAGSLEATRPDEAVALYRELAAEGGPWADNALFAQASLEKRRGHRAEARTLLERYLRRYPRGNNASIARTLLDDLR